jgi:O-antigen/teichoic acid export membrane protein
MLRVLAPLVAVRACAEFPLNGLLGLGKLGVAPPPSAPPPSARSRSTVLLIPALGWQGAVIGTYVSEVLLGVVAWLCLLHYQRKHDAALREVGDPAS